MSHNVTDDHEKTVSNVLKRALRIAKDLFKSEDPLLVMEIHDRLIARAHCCEDEAQDDNPPWK
jgi:hypothetical protein